MVVMENAAIQDGDTYSEMEPPPVNTILIIGDRITIKATIIGDESRIYFKY
jgi:hypothetical protein